MKGEVVERGLKGRYRVTNWAEYDRALVNPKFQRIFSF
jgi:hypothetical protein